MAPDEVIRAVTTGNVIMPSGQRQHRRRDAHLADELRRRHDQRSARPADSHRRRPAGVDPRRRLGERQHRHSDGVRPGERPARRLHPGHQAPDASTLSVVNEVKANLGRFQALVPDDITVSLRVRPVAERVGALAVRAARSGARRAADRPDGAAVPARLAELGDRRRHHPVRAARRPSSRSGAPARRSTS